MLFTTLQLRGLTLRNRIVLSPMLTYSATGGHVNNGHLVHYGKFAFGGVGLVFTESTKIHAAGCSTPRDLGLWKDEFIEPLSRIVQTIKGNGAAAGIQLGHSGRKARRAVPWEGGRQLERHPGVDHGEEWDLIAPSALAHPTYAMPRAMSQTDINNMIDAWGQAARRAHQAGFDVIEIHGAHGYLIHQFLSPASNDRKDRYGGSLENRMRFADEVVAHVREVWPNDKPLFFRVSAEDGAGWCIGDTIALARILRQRGVDVIDCSAGGMLDRPPSESVPSYGYQAQYAESVRTQADVMTMAVGMIVHADQAEEIISSGKANLVALGRELLHNPNWPLDAAQKLGIESPFAVVPPSSGFALQRRARNPSITPSTFKPGLG